LEFLTQDDIRKYAYTSLILALICLLSIIYLVAVGGLSNIYYTEDIQGTDVQHLDARTYSDETSVTASANNATSAKLHIAVDRGVQDGSGGESGQTTTSDFEVAGAKGGWGDKYYIVASNDGLKQVRKADKFVGDFIGSSKSVIIETGVPSLDNTVDMLGSSQFHGEIINGMTGRPVTTDEIDVVMAGKFGSYLNASIPKANVTQTDWLAFCAQSYHDVSMASEGGYYILPAGYDIDKSGNLARNSTDWQVNATTKRIELKPGVI
jgi:hypothetical protein